MTSGCTFRFAADEESLSFDCNPDNRILNKADRGGAGGAITRDGDGTLRSVTDAKGTFTVSYATARNGTADSRSTSTLWAPPRASPTRPTGGFPVRGLLQPPTPLGPQGPLPSGFSGTAGSGP